MTDTAKQKPDIKRIKAVFMKEFLQIRRDPRSFAIALLAPVVLLVLYGYAVTFDIRQIDMAVVDNDRTVESRELITKFSSLGYFAVDKKSLNDEEKAVEAMRVNRVKVVLIVPKGFSDDIKRNRNTDVQLLCDGSDANTISVAIGYSNAIVMSYYRKIMLHKVKMRGLNPKRIPSVSAEPRVWYNPEMKSTHFIVPGLIAILMMLIAGTLTSLTIVRERERGTFEQLISTPVKPLELMIGKLAPYVAIGFIDVLIVVLVGTLWFQVPFRGNFGVFVIFSAFFIFAAMGMGMLISSVAPNQTVAVIGTIMATMLPSILLSGFVFPVNSMPKVIQAISYIVPARYYLKALRALFLKPGADFALLWQEGLFLMFFGMLFLILSAKRFKKTL